jgi:hypothetical protein
MDEIVRWVPRVSAQSPGVWRLVELFGAFGIAVVAAFLAPLAVAIVGWGIGSGRWRGIYALAAYAVAVINLRALLFMGLVLFTSRGSPVAVQSFAVLFLLVVPALYLAVMWWRGANSKRAA